MSNIKNLGNVKENIDITAVFDLPFDISTISKNTNGYKKIELSCSCFNYKITKDNKLLLKIRTSTIPVGRPNMISVKYARIYHIVDGKETSTLFTVKMNIVK